jgi:GTPase
VAGSTDSGKSTLTAVLTHGADGRPLLDNGRGRARMAVLRHKHEIQSGRTSSISQALLGYDADGQVGGDWVDWVDWVCGEGGDGIVDGAVRTSLGERG